MLFDSDKEANAQSMKKKLIANFQRISLWTGLSSLVGELLPA